MTTLAVVGVGLGSLVNLAVYALAYHRPKLSPWSRARGRGPNFVERLPVVGWLLRRSDEKPHGRGFWIRPLVVELAFGMVVPLLYWHAVQNFALQPAAQMVLAPVGGLLTDDLASVVHVQFMAQVILLTLMAAASLIDADEKIIPDSITTPGTLVALLLAAAYPWMLPTASAWWPPGGPPLVEFTHVDVPNAWPTLAQGAPNANSLFAALACWTGWCFALLPRRWIMRRGFKQALLWFWGRIQREPFSWRILGLWAGGGLLIGAAWATLPREHWAGLLTSLVGLAASGGIIWIVRLTAGAALGREAMGFGDVTLMAMIGAYVGWQAAILIFFLAPFAGLVVGLLQVALRREDEIPYGPFLCLATAATIVCWPTLWARSAHIFELSWLVPVVLAVGLALMGVLLAIWTRIKQGLFAADAGELEDEPK